ncbi:MAG: carboxypeptidase regulatory-like domain-containing protein, partial [bacterium]|nr:carboxypeptidase regulatory-like domain-containing protein [bacterium]
MKPLFGSPILLLAAMATVAQNRTSAISGMVTDASGATVAGAGVLAHHIPTGTLRRAESAEGGRFRILRLEVGEYELTAEMEGFKTSRHEGLILELDRELVVDPVLQVGERAESVVVVGQARTIEASPSALTSLVDSNTIEHLPLNGRDYIQLATLQA